MCSELALQHQAAVEAHRVACASLQEQHGRATSKWEKEKEEYIEQLLQQVRDVDETRGRYESKAPEAIIDYCERVLSNSEYPSCIPREFDFEFNPDTGLMLLNSRLPAPDDLPKLVEVKYIQASDSFLSDHPKSGQP